MRHPVSLVAGALGCWIALGALLAPTSALAHAFGARYELPLPLWMWLSGAGAVVALSFVLVGVFFKSDGGSPENWRFDLMRVPGLRALVEPGLLLLARVVSVGLFCLIVVAGFVGEQTATENIAPVLVWVIWWVGFAYIAALLGDLWRLINPWSVLFSLVESATASARHRQVATYPAASGAWPAVVLFLIFAWLEVVSDAGENPAQLSLMIFIYSLITWAGMWRFGRDVWLENGEAFSVCFGLLARFSISRGEREAGKTHWYLRPPVVGLITPRPLPPSMVAFVVLLLATVSFDGIAETPFWAGVLSWFAENQFLRPALIAVQDFGVDLAKLVKTLGLMAVPLIFLGVYLFFSRLTAAASGDDEIEIWTIAGALVLTLIPIAIAYHLSHYFSYLMLAGQLVISLGSDPLGLGWNLFGTAERAIDISVVSAKTVWYLATIAVVAGHVFAVYLGHVASMTMFATRRAALRSQVPLLVLMVGYSMLSLWILAQPIVEI